MSVCSVEIPVGALVDARLALDPAAVRLLDVLAGRREDVEDEAAARPQQLARGAQRLEPLLVVPQVEIRAERARHERDALVDRRPAQVAEPQVEPLRRRRPRARARRRQPASRATSRRRSRARRRARSGMAIRPVPTASSTTSPPAASASST